MKITLLMLLFTSLSIPGAHAQKSDSLQGIRQFMQVCNAYKQVPLHLELDYSSSANFNMGEDDSSVVHAEFYLLPQVSYMRFGEIEQMVNDSLALLVSDKLQRMILYSNVQPVIAQMKSLMGMQIHDSSLIKLSGLYTAEVLAGTYDKSSIIVQSRAFLYGTSLPKETIETQYDPKTKMPARFTLTRRSLMPVAEADSSSIIEKYGVSKELVTVRDNRYFLVKTQTSTFLYKKIDHDISRLPSAFSDRIMKNKEGVYVPVRAYENYALTQNF